MTYRNKVYVCLGYDEDAKYYNLMKARKENEHVDFDFYNAHDMNNIRDNSSEEAIKRKLRERMNNSKLLIVLIGDETRDRRKYVPYEIELAIEHKMPIIGVNLNFTRKIDNNKCPPRLKNELAVFTSFNPKIISYAMEKRPAEHYQLLSLGKKEAYRYNDHVYDNLGVTT